LTGLIIYLNKMFEIKNCRVCNNKNLTDILSLGNQYISNFVDSFDEKEEKIPLEIVLCQNCKLLQLKHNAPPEKMWGKQYWYKSGISTTIKEDLKDIVQKSEKLVKLNKGDIVVDIGCNDGTLLSFYQNKEIELVGFEPSENVAREASSKGFNVINNFFNAKNFKEKFQGKKAKIITAISMFYDLEDPNNFVKDIVECLEKKGIFVIQQNYLVSMLEQNAFDNICHEHREYYSLTSLKPLIEKYGLEIFDVELNDINGGSIRTYIKFQDNADVRPFKNFEKRFGEIERKESAMGLNTLKPYIEFALRINGIKKDLVGFLKDEKKNGKKICIYGASTRGNVILQYFDLDAKLVDCIADKNSDKHGKKTVGSMIPIVSPEKMREKNPDYLLVMTWHFFEEIKKQENGLFERGVKFIVPLPAFKVISKN